MHQPYNKPDINNCPTMIFFDFDDTLISGRIQKHLR
jgi:hypothetical protein